MDIISYILSKKYTDNTVDGLGAIKGAPCTVKSVVDIDGGKRITLEWESNSGVKQTQSFDIMDGEDGANTVEWSQIQQSGTKIAEININGVSTDVYAPTGGGGSANIVNCTQAEYDALPSSKESDDVLYIVYFDGAQVLDPDYSYYTYGDNDEIIVRVYHEGQSDQQTLWFFRGWNQTSGIMPIPSSLTAYAPSDGGANPRQSKNYTDSTGTTQNGWLGFYANSIRTWDETWSTIVTGAMYSIVDPEGAGYPNPQTNPYTDDPYVYIPDGEATRRIYMNGREYAEFNGENGGSSWTDVEGTLLAGNTSVTLNNPSIKNTSNFEFFTDVFGICPTNAVISTGSVTLTFDEQATDLGVKVRVTNTNAASPYTFKSYLGVGNTAGAYINTGLNIATTQEFEVKFQLTNTQADNVVYFGCWQSYKDTMIYYYSGGFGCGVGGTITPRHNFDTDIHVYKAMQDAIYLDDIQDGNANWANAPTNVPYYLFKDPDHSGAINIRIYYAKIWDDGTLVRDFIPAVRNDDGVIGMYDQVNDVFYANDGTGSFITD